MPDLADTPVGAPGTVTGVTTLDAAEPVLAPTAFVAVTVNVYMSPLVKPVTTIGLPAPDTVCPPLPGVVVSVAVTVYPVMTEPPSLAGGMNATDTCPLPDLADTPVGAPGTVTWRGAITDTVLPTKLTTYAVFLVSFTATPYGVFPAVTMAVTVLLAPSITDTLPPTPLVTYTMFVVSFTATALGLLPTFTVADTVLLAPAITDTMPTP